MRTKKEVIFNFFRGEQKYFFGFVNLQKITKSESIFCEKRSGVVRFWISFRIAQILCCTKTPFALVFSSYFFENDPTKFYSLHLRFYDEKFSVLNFIQHSFFSMKFYSLRQIFDSTKFGNQSFRVERNIPKIRFGSNTQFRSVIFYRK